MSVSSLLKIRVCRIFIVTEHLMCITSKIVNLSTTVTTMKRQKNYLLLSKRQKNRRIELLTKKDLSCLQNTSDNNFKSIIYPINNNDQQNDCSDLDSASSSHSSVPEDNLECAFVEGYNSNSDSGSDNPLEIYNVDEMDPVESEFKKNIKNWSMNYLIPHNAINSLLAIMRSAGHTDLPKDARSLLHTPKINHVKQMSWGQYIHYGLEQAVVDQFKNISKDKRPQKILIDIHVDGISISKSSKLELWTILGKIYSPHFRVPFFIGAHASYGKPKSTAEYLHDFCKEYSKLSKEGFIFEGNRHLIRIRVVIADSPARSFVTCTKPFNSFYGCGKCFVRGIRVSSRTVFLERDCILRTDENFQQRTQIEHHLDNSPFEEVGLGMVTQFPLDYMHMVCLGIVKKLLHLWIDKRIITPANLKILSSNLIATRDYIPKEFARKCRALDELDRWKATEFRLFLYVGIPLLKDILPQRYYIHFTALSCATMILSDPVECINNNDYANDLLRYFVEQMSILYGDESVVYNVHNLIHIAADVQKFGPLDDFSAFPFESAFISLKKLLRKNDNPLAQLFNRISEQSRNVSPVIEKLEDYPILLNPTTIKLPLNCHNAHRSILFKSFTIRVTNNDSCCLLLDGTIIIVEYIGFRRNEKVVIGRKFNVIDKIPDYPCDSTLLSIYMVRRLSKQLYVWPVLNIRQKMFLIPLSDSNNYALPLVHTRVIDNFQ